MAFDFILGAGQIPATLPYLASVFATVGGGELTLNAGNTSKQISITVPQSVDIYYYQANAYESTSTTTSRNLTTTLLLNDTVLAQAGWDPAAALAPAQLLTTTNSNPIRLNKGDVFVLRVEVDTAIPGGTSCTIVGNISLYGKFA